ncbi:unnamed protein product [Chondrus crispus]|uniref:Tc1-like transposase DDE domain-containing protein n=1 Tax=Chondrus crispus TaxID=2769 RepID=R7QI95_CHOCR|nr:unnamed protein product [Chondrus crispus]CDF37794.1 unnamed protein product [Chondrus crispus]|eukprot:XP_005717665.1 unnamed protein product [Chondrus crispus]
MILGAFSSKGMSSLAFLNGMQDSAAYCTTLDNYLLPFAYCYHDDSLVFMQDGASIHRSNLTHSWLNQLEINLLPWPSRSPDLNPIENVWGHLARAVYANGRQFTSRDALVDAIQQCWNGIALHYCNSLISLMPSRCLKAIVRSGDLTGY